METTVKADVYARKLKVRLALLKKEREAKLALYRADLARWRTACIDHVKREAEKQIGKMSAKAINDHFHRRYHSTERSIQIEGVPRPPEYPGNDEILLVQRTLRLIAMTEPKTLRVDRDEMKKIFADETDDE